MEILNYLLGLQIMPNYGGGMASHILNRHTRWNLWLRLAPSNGHNWVGAAHLFTWGKAKQIQVWNTVLQRGRLSKKVANGSKRTVMAVIDSLCVSLGSSTVQLHESMCQMHMFRGWLQYKTATVLEKYTTEEQRSVVHFLLTKGLNVNDIHKEVFPVYSGKCFSWNHFTAVSINSHGCTGSS
jgi:hypothetical protein